MCLLRVLPEREVAHDLYLKDVQMKCDSKFLIKTDFKTGLCFDRRRGYCSWTATSHAPDNNKMLLPWNWPIQFLKRSLIDQFQIERKSLLSNDIVPLYINQKKNSHVSSLPRIRISE